MKLFLILLLLPFVFACSNKNDLPEGILPPPKMQEVMWDMIRAGEFLNALYLAGIPVLINRQ